MTTSARARKTTTTAARPARRMEVPADEGTSACELLVAELKARRKRLQQLLKQVRLEVAQSAVACMPARTHSKRHSAAMKRIA